MNSDRLRSGCAALLLLSSILLPGCGSTAGDPRAQKLLKDATRKMASVKSLKEAGVNDMRSGDGAIPPEKVTFESEMELSDPSKPASHTVLQRGAQKVDVYTAGGFLYSEADGKWVKSPVKGTSSVTPSDISVLAAGAEKAKVAGSGGAYRVSFDVSSKALEELDLFGSGASASEGSAPAGSAAELKMSATYTISRDTMLVEKVVMVLSIPDVTGSGTTRGVITVNFKDIDQPVDVALPEAAKSATEQ
jgi:hypothetical protein